MVVKQNLLSNLNPYRPRLKNKNVVHGGSYTKRTSHFYYFYALKLTFKVHKNITQWQSTYGYLGSYLGWDPSAYQYGMLTYENVSVDSKESSAGIFP